LPDAHRSGEVEDGFDAAECSRGNLLIAHVSDDQLDVGMQVRRAAAGRMNLPIERIEHANAVAARDQRIGNMRTDEARAAGD
jgi:hypothetical protein